MKKYVQILFLFVVTVLFFSSCVRHKKLILINNQEQNVYALENEDFKIQKGDLLDIKVVGLDQKSLDIFNRKISGNATSQFGEAALFISGYIVDNLGYIELPIVGKIEVANKTLDEVKKSVSQEMIKYYKHFTVDVKIINYKITLLGEVKESNTYNIYEKRMNIFQALGFAKGVTDYANLKKVKLIRRQEENIVAITLDLSSIDIYKSEYYYLQPNDVIYVPPVKAKVLKINAGTISFGIGILTLLSLLIRIKIL